MTTEYAEVEIEITRELAMRGERKVCMRCPVALALNHHLLPGVTARVGTYTFNLMRDVSIFFDGELPLVARRFVDRYDHKLSITFPVKFTLALPKQVLKQKKGNIQTNESQSIS